MRLIKIIAICFIIVSSFAHQDTATTDVQTTRQKLKQRSKMRGVKAKRAIGESADKKKSSGSSNDKREGRSGAPEKKTLEIAGRSGGLNLDGSALRSPSLEQFSQNRQPDKGHAENSLTSFGNQGSPLSSLNMDPNKGSGDNTLSSFGSREPSFSSMLNDPTIPEPSFTSNPQATTSSLGSGWPGQQNNQDTFGQPPGLNTGFPRGNTPNYGRNNQETPNFNGGQRQEKPGLKIDECHFEGRILRVGDKWSVNGICGLYTCQGNRFRTVTTDCPPLKYQEGSPCDVQDQDLALDFPNCCPKLVCSNKNETYLAPIATETNPMRSPYSTPSNSYKNIF